MNDETIITFSMAEPTKDAKLCFELKKIVGSPLSELKNNLAVGRDQFFTTVAIFENDHIEQAKQVRAILKLCKDRDAKLVLRLYPYNREAVISNPETDKYDVISQSSLENMLKNADGEYL